MPYRQDRHFNSVNTIKASKSTEQHEHKQEQPIFSDKLP